MKAPLACALFALALPLALPASAHANVLKSATFALSDSHAELTLVANEPLDAPRIRLQPGVVLLWFPSMDDAWLDPPTDGRAIRNVRVRPGAGGSAVVRVRLGNREKLTDEQVVVLRQGTTTRIAIPRSALPAPRTASPLPGAVVPVVQEPAVVPAVELNAPTTAPTALAPAQAPTEAQAPPAGQQTDADETVPAAPPVVPDEVASPHERETVPAPPIELPGRTTRTAAQRTTPLAVMLFITVLLGVAYAAMRLFFKKGHKTIHGIDIVASRRLGGRHQLVLVRALGEDHLLSVNAGKTQRLASTPAPRVDAEPDGAPEDTDEGGIIRRLESRLMARRGRKTLGAGGGEGELPSVVPLPDGLPREARTAPKPPQFGAQLLKFADEVERRRSSPAPGARTGESDAVAGIRRLRRRAAQ